MLIFCDLVALTNEEREIILDKIYKALKPGGIFIFDVFTKKNRNKDDLGRSWEIKEIRWFCIFSVNDKFKTEKVLKSFAHILIL